MAAPVVWEVVASDMFDRSSPPTVDERGAGLTAGLEALWRRTLTEGVHDDGGRTFTTFQLCWDGGHTDAGARSFDNLALARLRSLVYGTPGPYQPGGLQARAEIRAREDRSLLRLIAETHARLLAGAKPYDVGWAADSPAGLIRARVSAATTASELTALLPALSR